MVGRYGVRARGVCAYEAFRGALTLLKFKYVVSLQVMLQRQNCASLYDSDDWNNSRAKLDAGDRIHQRSPADYRDNQEYTQSSGHNAKKWV